MKKYLSSFIFGMTLLLASCGTTNTPAPETPAPALAETRSIPSPEFATPMKTATPFPPTAANADVIFVRAVQAADGSWTFSVTVRHPDTGWDDYADGWDILTPDGAGLKRNADDPFTRLLVHPHVDEQPFTRSQSGLIIPEGVTQVTVRAHDLLDGFGGREILVDLDKASGEGFEVERK
ncbi:MAG: hypothetical protein L3J16_03490 [Anaerolineales bacterium]|nr:hypothetical protein [Anaerolineales bacterium]